MTAIEIISRKMEHSELLDPHSLASSYPHIDYEDWRKILKNLWETDSMPGYTVDFARGNRILYYFVGKQDKVSFKFNWSSLLGFFKR